MAVSSKSSSKKLVRNPNQPSLKSQGAGYSTTNTKTGVTTYYKSSKDAAGYSDTTQSRSNMSKGTPLSAVDSAGKAITADKLAPVNKITLPTPPAVDGMFGVQDGISAGLAGSIGGTYDTTKKAIVPGQPEAPTTPPPTATSIFQNYMQSQLDGFNEQTTSESRLKEQQKMLRPKENLVNSLAGQVNTITANRDAQMLALEGQGRGQTGSFVGGEQARISREAAIQAMPIQAQLAIAQDDLESARSYASQLFQAQSQDAQNAYNFKKELNASIYNFLNDQEKTRVAQNEKALDRAFSIEQANRSNLKQLSMQAIEYGQGALAGEIMKLDPNSPTFDADFGDVTSRLREPVVATGGGSAWELKDVNGVSSWVNKSTQEIKPAGGVDSSNLKPIKDAEIKDLSETWTAKNSVMALVDSLQKNIRDNGTQVLWGTASGDRTGDTTNLLLAMKNLEKTGALDAGTIKVLEGTIPSSKFFATEDAQVASLQSIKDTISAKVDEYVGSYRGTSAEVDPRTKRIYGDSGKVDISTLPKDLITDVYNLFGVSQSTSSGAFNADQWLK